VRSWMNQPGTTEGAAKTRVGRAKGVLSILTVVVGGRTLYAAFTPVSRESPSLESHRLSGPGFSHLSFLPEITAEKLFTVLP